MSESDSQEDLKIKAEIQELLGQINDDMSKLKTELNSMNDLIEENAFLPMTMKKVNEKLIISAREAGIDIENLSDTRKESLRDLEGNEDGSEEGNEPVVSDSGRSIQMSNAGALSAAADELSQEIQDVLK